MKSALALVLFAGCVAPVPKYQADFRACRCERFGHPIVPFQFCMSGPIGGPWTPWAMSGDLPGGWQRATQWREWCLEIYDVVERHGTIDLKDFAAWQRNTR